MVEGKTASGVARDDSTSRAEIPPGLATLHGVPLGPYTLRLANVTPRGYVEQVNFDLLLVHDAGHEATPPVFSGIYSSGRPAAGIVGWVDGVYCNLVRFPDGAQIDLARSGLDRLLFGHLGELIPPNGRLMVAYEAFHVDSPILRQTREALRRGVPPLATPIGELLFHANCWLGVRDWYIPEGGREGHRKLQGNKALDARHRRRRAEEAVQQLLTFLDRADSAADALVRAAGERSRSIIADLLACVSDDLRRQAQDRLRVKNGG